jgi:hypothetical protein
MQKLNQEETFMTSIKDKPCENQKLSAREESGRSFNSKEPMRFEKYLRPEQSLFQGTVGQSWRMPTPSSPVRFPAKQLKKVASPLDDLNDRVIDAPNFEHFPVSAPIKSLANESRAKKVSPLSMTMT